LSYFYFNQDRWLQDYKNTAQLIWQTKWKNNYFW